MNIYIEIYILYLWDESKSSQLVAFSGRECEKWERERTASQKQLRKSETKRKKEAKRSINKIHNNYNNKTTI